MAPPPEYDKEPKAPDKSAITVTNEEIKGHTLVNELPTFSDHKTTNSAPNNEIENNKHVECLDDGQLRALLDEAIQYKCPKDREGKSSLFKELLEEVEHQDEVSEAASRGFIARGGPHANSLQDLMAALKVESATRPVRHQPPPHSQTSVSARAIHGGSLPSGVDTSFLLSEEPPRAGYLATVRCVNPPPLAERRVSASDANTPAEMELLNKSKPIFPMYTARASLEIGSGSVCSGRAVTTTTPSNQVEPRPVHWSTTRGPPERIYTPKRLYRPDKPTTKQDMLLNALRPKRADAAKDNDIEEGSTKPSGTGINISREGRQKTPEKLVKAVESWYKELPPKFAAGGKEDAKGSVNCGKDVGVIKPRGPGHTDIRKVANTHRKPLKNTGLSATNVHSIAAPKIKPPDSKTNTGNRDVGEANTKLSKVAGAKIDRVPIIRSKCAAGGKEESNILTITTNSQNVGNTTDKKQTKSSAPSGIKNTCKAPQKRAKRSGSGKEDVEKSKTADVENIRLCGFDSNNDRVPKLNQVGSNWTPNETEKNFGIYTNAVDNWYKGLTSYTAPLNINYTNSSDLGQIKTTDNNNEIKNADVNPNIHMQHIAECSDIYNPFAPKFESNLTDEEHIDHTLSASFNVRNKLSQDDTCDIKEYRKRVGKIVRASVYSVNPRNVRSMTIGKPEPIDIGRDIITNPSKSSEKSGSKDQKEEIKPHGILKISHVDKTSTISPITENQTKISRNGKQLRFELENETIVSHGKISQEMDEVKVKNVTESHGGKGSDIEHSLKKQIDGNQLEMKDMSKLQSVDTSDIEMTVISSQPQNDRDVDSFSSFFANQQNLLKSLESANHENSEDVLPMGTDTNNNDDVSDIKENAESTKEMNLYLKKDQIEDNSNDEKVKEIVSIATTNTHSLTIEVSKYSELKTETNIAVTQMCKLEDPKPGEQYVLAELSNNAYIFLTFPKRLAPPQQQSIQLQEIENNNMPPNVSSALVKRKNTESNDCKKKKINKNSLRVHLLESLFKLDGADRGHAVDASADKEVDATIPFSCITTPEVVASCNTTSSTAQAAVAVDPKPRSVMASTFNGLPLSRGYGAAASAADEYKKSLDENGNAVQGIGSPVSGSSQHKKPRRKKSSKNETVIKSHQIDGYQGNKDLNEVLRFIESNADVGRQGKLRGKHKDDDDKGKKRSAERRKDKEKVKRASSLEELSRTKLEDLTDAPEPPPAKPERRSWGDDARDAFYFRAPEPESAPAPDADFQTVTKRRKPRRRDAERDERTERDARRTRPPEPRARRESAPPSDRSNDSNDDMDSVHSLPAPAPKPLAPAPAHASYADIARTRHNIPDLIESCNFYAEGEGGGDARRAEPAPVAADADGYPALEPRAGARRQAAKPAGGAPAPRRERKERAPAAPADCPAPDVVADRRPPVILLDSAARPRDMDGVTFGFDINEQLLSGPARRARCDLLRDAAAADTAPAAAAVLAVAGCALRYVPPAPPPDTHHLHQIIDYVGTAWEDVIRCGAGKVRYFSE